MTSDPRDIIEVVEYDPRWPLGFERERVVLLGALADVGPMIEHIGSTAVPGLCAKPVIDILVGVPVLESAWTYAPLVEPIGYVHVLQDDEPRRLFFRKGLPRTHHLHIVAYGGREWKDHIAFRDRLRSDPDLRDQYAELKRSSAEKHRDDREAYVRSKEDFIRRMVDGPGRGQ